MEQDADSGNNAGLLKSLDDSDERPRSAVNSVILDYYKKFGRKRDLEQYFSLSTAQSDIRDPRSLFWRRMKEQSDTSDSGEKKSESSNEICRISIRCSIPETSLAEKRDTASNDSESPPIITDIAPTQSPSGDESMDDNHSQKSADATLDTSINKPLSPTSSITSQRKLEWDSLADVGYGNESDRKTSASSLSTLEREVLAQKQQYTIDYKQNSDLGVPTAHSTPVDPNDSKPKSKKGQGKKTISISRKEVDFVEVNVPHNMENVQPINVNLTKQFSVNLQKDGGMTIDNFKRDITVSPEKNVAEVDLSTGIKFDKEVQTSLLRSKEKDLTPMDNNEKPSTSAQKNPILIGLNTLKRKQTRKKIRKSKIKLKSKRNNISRKEIIADKDKSAEQVSEAESFEYMPGHMYNQNKLKTQDQNRSNNNNNIAGNKSSLESSAVHTTDSSKESKYSFNKDLDKTLNVLKCTLKEKYDSNLKKKLIKEIIQRLLKSNYGEGEATPDFLSVLSLTSKKTPTTSTSEADTTQEKIVHSKPKKSILRVNKFDPMNIASTSQSAPNLPSAVNSDKPIMSHLSKITSSSTTETDMSNNSAKDSASSSDTFAKTSSEELYKKYIDALKKEEAYKQHLKDKELFLKHKLVRSGNVKKVPLQLDLSRNTKLKELMKDLTRNNYDDGSGDASKLEGGSSSNFDIGQRVPRKHRSHSVFTLSSGNSEVPNQRCNAKNILQKEKVNSPRAGPSNWDRNLAGSCNKPTVTDSSVQVNINTQDKPWSCSPPNLPEEAKYVCLCSEKTHSCPFSLDEMKAYKCANQKPITVSKTYSVVNQPVCGMHSAGSRPRTDKPIIECTRCLQTKISIHPKISDPSVSDVNIIHSAECVKLIEELYNKVSRTNSECQCSNQKDNSNSYTCKSSKDNMRRNEDRERDNLIEDENDLAPLTDQPPIEQNVIQSCVGCHKTFTNQPESISDNIVIPIHGTNMMLKLSIGGKSMKANDKQTPKEMAVHTSTLDRDTETDKIKTILKGTSILDDFSKSAQARSSSNNVNMAALASRNRETNQEKDFSPRKPVRCGQNNEQVEEINANIDNYASVPHTMHSVGRNTYPKKVQISEKRPLFRSNTDTGNLGASIQTDTIYTKDKDTLPCFRAEVDQASVPKNQPKSNGACGPQSQSNKETPSEHSISGSSKSSTDEKFHSFHSFKNKKSAEWHNSKEKKVYEDITDEGQPNDLILDVIKDITRRYSKRDTDKRSKKKCFKEIMTALSYLLDTDDSGDGDQELSKKSQNFKKVLYTREQSSESEPISEHLNETERNKAASSRRNSNNRTANISNENIKESSERNTKMESSKKVESRGRETVKSNMGSGSSGIKSPRSENHETKSNPKTCVCGCGLPDCKECMTSLSSEAGRTDKESCGIEKRSKQTSVKNKMHDEESLKPSTSYNPPNKIDTCDMGCGCDGSSECKDCVEQDYAEYGTSTSGKESARSNKQESSCQSPKGSNPTCDKGCGCDGSSECKECGDSTSPKYRTGTCNEESARSNKQVSRCQSPKATKPTCEKGCGCDGSSECKESLQYKIGRYGKETTKLINMKVGSNSPKTTTNSVGKKNTCDKGSGCDGSSEYNESGGPQSPKPATGKCRKDSVRPKTQERCNSPKKPKTCDKGCGCDGSSECSECVEPHSPKSGTGKCVKDSIRPKKQKRSNSPKKPETCDKSCGCDGSSECNECGEPHPPGTGTGKCGKYSMKSKKQNRSSSPKKTKTTCDKACGCDGSSECNECSEHHSSKYGSGKCGKDSIRSKKQDRSNSPKRPQTCDRGCGCDGLSECSECVEPHSPKYGTGRCAKESVRPNLERCNSPKIIKTTCDKSCGCYGVAECTDCNHKTGRCSKEMRCKRQDAKKFVKCVQSTVKRVKSLYSHCDESSDMPVSTDPPCRSTDSPTSKLVHKIKKECEKYQKHKFCKKCEASSSTTVSCDHCRRADKYKCRHHKCRCHRSRSMEKIKKKCVAYNLIVQTSDSLISEEAVFDQCRKLQNVVIRVPKCRQANIPFKEACAKIEQKLPYCDTRFEPKGRSQSWPNECAVSSTDDVKIANACTVREYLERNRPDIVDRCATRQNCIKMISESRNEAPPPVPKRMNMVIVHTPNCTGCTGQADMYCEAWLLGIQYRAERGGAEEGGEACRAHTLLPAEVPARAKARSELREQLVGLGSLPSLSNEELEYLAKQLGYGHRRNRPLEQKIMSEREMKKHSEDIYKSLPEVKQKKENAKKESIKKTNLLMANIFKKNLQKKTLSGDVNISNYSQVIKI